MKEIEHVSRASCQPRKECRRPARRIQLRRVSDLVVGGRHSRERGPKPIASRRIAKPSRDAIDLIEDLLFTASANVGIEHNALAKDEQVAEIEGVDERRYVPGTNGRVGAPCRFLKLGRILKHVERIPEKLRVDVKDVTHRHCPNVVFNRFPSRMPARLSRSRTNGTCCSRYSAFTMTTFSSLPSAKSRSMRAVAARPKGL